jgi:hypothetical protein
MTGDAEWDLEQEDRERSFWRRVRQIMWTGVIVLGALALMWTMATFPAWRGLVVLAILGVLAGICFGFALGRTGPQRPLAGLVFGGVTLPLLAAYLGSTAARDPNEFHFAATGLAVFFAYGLAALFAVLWITAIWRRAPRRGRPEETPGADILPHEGVAP